MARPVEQSTSLQRTYRYLRISIAATVPAIFVSVALAAASVGWLTSVSDYFYTPARNVFVGALIAVSVALLALSGRGPERALLDAAALFAPLIALVPTTLAPGTVAGVEVPCAYRCFPPEYEADVENGVLTYVIVGLVAIGIALVLVRLRQSSFGDVAFSLGLALVVLAAVGLTWAFARDAFLQQGHFVATVAFFALFAAVAVLNAFPRGSRPAPSRGIQAAYVVIAVLLAITLVVYVALGVFGIGLDPDSVVPLVLIVEATALSLFCAFWVVQCVEKWNEGDPAARIAVGIRAVSYRPNLRFRSRLCEVPGAAASVWLTWRRDEAWGVVAIGVFRSPRRNTDIGTEKPEIPGPRVTWGLP